MFQVENKSNFVCLDKAYFCAELYPIQSIISYFRTNYQSFIYTAFLIFIMSKFITFKPIGEILQEADLITSPQLEVALRDQNYYQDMRLGEILALRGWIKQDTADFFVQEWFKLVNQRIEHPIGFYLNKAGLLSEEDIGIILSEQHRHSLRFGDTAVKQGLIKPNTVNFFLQNLFPSQLHNARRAAREIEQQQKERITKDDITYWVTLSSAKLTHC